jgi:8-oxo-dGTP diphosphatase
LASKPIHAAGGIVVRKGARRLVAIVQRSKDDRWVLPRGKLKRTERAVVGARREVVEETGHRVKVREYLGAITYRASGRPKVVQFWRMQAAARPSHDLMKDIAAVEWLPLKAAIRRLSYPLEKLFLDNVGRAAIGPRKHARRKAAESKSGKSKNAKSKSRKSKSGKSKSAKAKRAKSKRPKSKGKAKAKSKRRPAAHPAAKLHLHTSPSAPVAHNVVQYPAVQHNAAPSVASAHVERRSVLQRVLGTLGR